MKSISDVGRAVLALGACLLVFFITRGIYRDEATPPVENSRATPRRRQRAEEESNAMRARL